MNDPASCPPPKVIEQLLADGLGKAESTKLCDHLLKCEICRRRFEQRLDDETVNDQVRRIMESEDDAFPRSLIELISELKKFPDVRGTTTIFSEGSERLKNRVSPPVDAIDNILDRFRFLAPAQENDELARLETFKLLSVLGEGSYGVVFKAFDEHLHRFVAIKAMLPDIARRDKSKERFLREGRALASIQHENVVGVHHVGICKYAPYMVMEFLEGTPLDVHLRKHKKLPLTEVESIGIQIASGLEAAHAKSLIHRDIKPANIWLEASSHRIKLLDFGLAKSVDHPVTLTLHKSQIGSPAYMSPEQTRCENLDYRSDLFSVGIVLYELASGRLPFMEKTLTSLYDAIREKTPTPLIDFVPGMSKGFSDIVMHLLQKQPGDRPSSAAIVANALNSRSDGSIAPPTPLSAPLPSWMKSTIASNPIPRRKAALIGASLLGSVFVCGLAFNSYVGSTRPALWVIQNLPEDANLLLDEKPIEFTRDERSGNVEFPVEPGDHMLAARLDGFESQSFSIEATPGETKTIALADFSKAPADDGFTELLSEESGLSNFVILGNPNAIWRVGMMGGLLCSWKRNADVTGGASLLTKDIDYRDFRLRVVSSPCRNWASSILIGASNILTRGSGQHYRIQIGAVNGEQGFETGTIRRSMREEGIISRPFRRLRLKEQTFFTMEVEVRGRQIRVFFDGELVNESMRPMPVPQGSIGIALSGDSHMLIRSMSVKRLEPAKG